MGWRTHSVEIRGLEAGVIGSCPASNEDRPRWFMVTKDNRLLGIDGDTGASFFESVLPGVLGDSAEVVASSDGRFVAVVPTNGLLGVLVDTTTATVVKTLERSDYHADVSGWAVSMVRRNNRDILICASAWNRLEAFELPSLRSLVAYDESDQPDYFYGLLTASPSGKWVATSGWVWHPVGITNVFDVDEWLSHGGSPQFRDLAQTDWWDAGVCFLDDERLVMLGDAPSEELGDEVPFFNQQTGLAFFGRSQKYESFVPEAVGGLACDGSRLFLLAAESTRTYELATGAWLEPLPRRLDAWHPDARVFLSCPPMRGESGRSELLWLPQWRSSPANESVKALARALRAPIDEGLLVLADALEESQVVGEAIGHCRAREPHGARCWVVEGLID